MPVKTLFDYLEAGDSKESFLEQFPSVSRSTAIAAPVVTRAALHAAGLTVICLISQGALQSRFAGFAASLLGTGTVTQGVVMCYLPRTVDLVARRARKVETLPQHVIDDVLARMAVLID